MARARVAAVGCGRTVDDAEGVDAAAADGAVACEVTETEAVAGVSVGSYLRGGPETINGFPIRGAAALVAPDLVWAKCKLSRSAGRAGISIGQGTGQIV